MNIRQALEWTRDNIRNNTFRKIEDYEFPEGKNGFSMTQTHKKYECGSVACIGGWAWVGLHLDEVERKEGLYLLSTEQVTEADNFVWANEDGELSNLFFPPSRMNYRHITPEHAAQAIDNYLATGEANWNEVMKDVRESEYHPSNGE